MSRTFEEISAAILATLSHTAPELSCERGTPERKIIDISYEDFRQQTPVNTEPSRQGAENIIAQFPEGVSRNVGDYVDTGILDGLKKLPVT